jgi:hypothetical protein
MSLETELLCNESSKTIDIQLCYKYPMKYEELIDKMACKKIRELYYSCN